MQSDWLEESPESGSSGKTCPDASARPKTAPAPHSAAYSAALRERMQPLLLKDGRVLAWSMEKADEWRGPCSMHNSLGFHNAGGECSHLPSLPSLMDILETGPIPQKYYLSAKACAGILRRAEKRGKVLPPALHTALEAAASTQAKTEPDEERR